MKFRSVYASKRGHGFSRVDLVAVVLVCVVLGGPLLLSAMSRYESRLKQIGCVNNLKDLGLGFKTWALDHGDKFPMPMDEAKAKQENRANEVEAYRCFELLSNELAAPKILVCPADTRRPAENLDAVSNSNLSYFVGIDGEDANPQMLLMGDRNLTNGLLPANRVLVINTNLPVGWTREMHGGQGNIGLADGSVQQYTSSRLTEALRNSSGTGRLAFP